MSVKERDLDAPIWGAKAIARELNLFTEEKHKTTRKPTGKIVPDERKAFYLLETGAIRAKQVRGRDDGGKEKQRGQWVTTLRLIRQSLLPIDAT
jgi:hypothetical protein